MDVGDHPQGQEVHRQFVVACAQRATLLEPTDDSLDDVPLPVRWLVEVRVGRLILAGRNDRADVVAAKPAADSRVAVALVAGHLFRPPRVTGPARAVGAVEDRFEGAGVVSLAGRDENGQNCPCSVADEVDLGAEAASRAAQRMVCRFIELRTLRAAQARFLVPPPTA